MGEALITRRGGGGKVQTYSAKKSISHTSLYESPYTIKVGFTPDVLCIARTATANNKNYIVNVKYAKLNDDDVWGSEYTSTICGDSEVYHDLHNVLSVTETDTGLTLQLKSNYTVCRFSGTYKIFAVKYT